MRNRFQTRRLQQYPKSHELSKILVLYDGEQTGLSNGTKTTRMEEFRLLHTSEYNTRNAQPPCKQRPRLTYSIMQEARKLIKPSEL
jgi:hypothetical protein